MVGFFYILHVIVSILVIAVVLFQDGKTGGLVSVADSSQSVFGAKGASSFLTKLTSILAIIFLALSFGLAKNGSEPERSIAADVAPATTQSSTGADVTTGKTTVPEEQPLAAPSADQPNIEISGEEANKVKGVEVVKDPNQLPEELKKLAGAKANENKKEENPEGKKEEKPKDKKDN